MVPEPYVTLPSGARLVTAWLVLQSGTRLAISAAGVRLGRHPENDIFVSREEVSRYHGIFRATETGFEYVPLGRGATKINGQVIRGPTEICDGDRVEVPGCDLRVEVEAEEKPARIPWVLHYRGAMHGLSRFPFHVGGGPADHLILEGWPPAAVQLHPGPNGLKAQIAGLTVNGEPMEAGTLELEEWDELQYGGQVLVLRRSDPGAAEPTKAALSSGPVLAARIRFRSRGGEVALELPDREAVVELLNYRADLIAALLRPGAPYGPGDYVPDEALAAKIWGPASGKGRTDLNSLIHRVRADFNAAGIAGHTILQREPGGGGTRILLAEGAKIHIE